MRLSDVPSASCTGYCVGAYRNAGYKSCSVSISIELNQYIVYTYFMYLTSDNQIQALRCEEMLQKLTKSSLWRFQS